MDKILSQDEINALFSTMSADGAALENSATGQGSADLQVARYDFCRSDRIAKEQIRAIHSLHTHFARSYSSSLSAYLRALVEVNLIAVDQIPYTKFLKQLSDPTLFCALSVSPLRGNFAMELSPAMVFPVLDILLGGAGKSTAENRTLTDIEMQVIEGVVKLALRDLKESWRPVLEMHPKLEGSETKPQMLQIVAPAEAVVAIGFEVKVGENAGLLNLCIPSVILKMNRSLFDQQKRHRHPLAGGSETERISDVVRSARITLSGEIRDEALAVEDLLQISVGDVIQLNQPLSDPVRLNVGGVPKFMGRIVARRGRRAFEITHKYLY
jgi:flagellar motor switch protein FliM